MRRRVITSPHGAWVDPAECFLALAKTGGPLFWLDSGEGASAGMSCLGVGSRVVTATPGALHEWPSEVCSDESVFDFLRREQAPGVRCDDQAAFPLGWVGWLGYELLRETLTTDTGRQSRYPDAAFLLAETSIVFDHAAQSVTLVALGDSWSGELEAWRAETHRMLSQLEQRELDSAGSGPRDAATAAEPPATHGHASSAAHPEWAHPEWAHPDSEYLAMIDQCQQSIRAGDAYQLCLTTELTVEAHPDPVDAYVRLRKLSPSHHGGFLRIGEVHLLSFSPEKFLTVTASGEVESKPIKGTRKRGATRDEDEVLRRELLASDKERAENLMIVDLVRNDLARVCEIGSVRVTGLLEVESYAHVHQLVSTVRGTLLEGNVAVDAVLACFPAGSMTGAPKLSAVNLLDALERRPRGVYSGAWGYFGFDGSVDLAMTIRTVVIDANGVSIGTGGGITALSVPAEELEETRIKVAALVQALGLVTL